VPKFYGSKCPGPFFELPKATTVQAAGRTFTITGSTMKLEGGPWKGPLKIGVLGAIKDPDTDTRDNLKRAMKQFKKLGVHFVVANGDLIGDEAGDLAKVIKMVGEEIPLPVFVHSGNYEWTTAFTDVLAAEAKAHPQVFNMNLLRHIDLGGVHLFSLPGWSNRKFVKAAACYYGKRDVEELKAQLKPVVEKGEVAIITAHGPPRGQGKQSIDYAFEAGNVGDEDLQRMIIDLPIRFGLFSHILEAGGRATSDIERQPPIKLPMRTAARSLYINAGSASSFAYPMLDKKTSRGMAAVFTLDDIKNGGKARVTFLKLR
jgi:Icc-related predicted phosphoesterase